MHETGDREGNQGEKRSEMDQKNRLGQAERPECVSDKMETE